MDFSVTKKTLTLFAGWTLMGFVVQREQMAAGGVFAALVCTPVALVIDWRLTVKARRGGAKAGAAMTGWIDKFIETRFPEIRTQLVAVFEQELRSVPEDPPPAQLRLLAVWKVFVEEVQKDLPPRVKQELRDVLPQLDDLNSPETRDLFDQYLVRQIQAPTLILMLDAYLVLMRVYLDAEKRQPFPEGKDLLIEAQQLFPDLPEAVSFTFKKSGPQTQGVAV